MINDKITMENLVRIKQVFLHGQNHRRKKTNLDDMIAIQHYSWSIELFLRQIATTYNLRIKYNDIFDIIWKKVDEQFKIKFKTELPNRNLIEKVVRNRNLVIHSGTLLSNTETERNESYTLTFLDDVLNKEYNTSLADLRISSLIKDKRISKLLRSVEREMNHNNDRLALRILGEIFIIALNRKEEALIDSGVERYFPIGHSVRIEDDKIDRAFDQLIDSINSFLIFNMLDIDLKDRSRFDDLYNAATTHNLGKLLDPSIKDFSPNQEEIKFCYDFVVDLLLMWQSK